MAAGYSGATFEGTARFIRLRTVTMYSSDSGAKDPFSHPAILPLPHGLDSTKLRVEATDRTTYVFKYWSGRSYTPVGWGNSSEVGALMTICRFLWHSSCAQPPLQVSGGFVGTIVGIFATGNGQEIHTPALFWDWSYIGKPDTI